MFSSESRTSCAAFRPGISTSPHRTPRRLLLISVAAAAVALSGCAAGQISQTAQQVAAIDGGNATVGSIGVRNALLATPAGSNYAPGSDVGLQVVLTNTGLDADTLTAVSTPAAGAVTLPDSGVQVPAQTNVTIGAEGQTGITLTGLTRALCYGQSIPLTFSFQNAGQVTLNVPIELPSTRTGERETIEIQPPHPTPLWESGGHAAEEAEAPAEESSAGGSAGGSSVAESSAGGSSAASASGAAGQSAAPGTACNNQAG